LRLLGAARDTARAMSEKEVERIRETFAAFARGDATGFKETLNREMTWHSALVPLLQKTTYHGPDEIWRLLSDEIPAVLEGFGAEVIEIEDLGDTTLATVRFSGTATSTGLLVEQTVFQLWRHRNGKGIEMRAFRRRGEALEAAGLKE
jgi:ketosteroid isomerase-like protein